jgi:glycosyltransferase involved in cell wall biosynthesis
VVDVSVVIPTYRRPALLADAIASVLAQERESTEVIVVDDCPDGSARQTVERFRDPRLSYLQSDPISRGRPGRVRNAGWPRAQGRFVHFLDDDDVVADGFYRAAIDTFDYHPGHGVVFGRVEPFTEGNGASPAMDHERALLAAVDRRARLASLIHSRRWMTAHLLFRNTLFVNSACIIRRECLEALGGYDPEIGVNEGVEFFCRAIRMFGFEFLDRVVVRHRILGDSVLNGRTNNDKLVESYQRMRQQYRQAHGAAELFAMKVFAQTVLRVL